MQVVTLTAAQSKQVSKLRNAQWMIRQASNELRAALGGTDIGDEYDSQIKALLQDLELDIISIGHND